MSTLKLFKVTKNGKVSNSIFNVWNPITKTFSTTEDGLEIDFGYMNDITINCGNQSTIHAYGKNVIVNCGKNCKINLNCNEPINVNTGNYCYISTTKRFHFIRRFFNSLFNR